MGAKQGDPGTDQGVMGAHSGAMVGGMEKTEMGEGHGKTGRSSRFSFTDAGGAPKAPSSSRPEPLVWDPEVEPEDTTAGGEELGLDGECEEFSTQHEIQT